MAPKPKQKATSAPVAKRAATRTATSPKRRVTRNAHAGAPPRDLILSKRRRDFTVIDQLPKAIKTKVQAMFDDASMSYQDIADFVLIHTSPPAVRAQVKKKLQSLKKKAEKIGGSAWQNEYEKLRRVYRNALLKRKDIKQTTYRPVHLCDSQLSRDFRSRALMAREFAQLIAMHGEAFEQLGEQSFLGIGLTTANLLQLRVQMAIENAGDDLEALNKYSAVIKAAAGYFNAMVNYERERSKRNRVVREVADQYIASVKDELAKDDDLCHRVVDLMQRVAEELSQ